VSQAQLLWIDSPAGHLICCNADPNATRRMGSAITEFLRALVEANTSMGRREEQ
jgi:hypothetical protein